MNKWFVMAIGLLLGGSIVSCKDNDLIPEQNTKQEQTASGKMREEKIYGDFSATLPVPKSDKALTLVDNGGTGGAQTGHPLIDWHAMFDSLKGRKIIMHCAIRNDAYDCSGLVGTDHLFYMDVPCEMKQSGDGYKLIFNEEIFQKYLQSKTLPVYTRLDNTWKIDDSNNNKWELQALCFMGNEPGNAPKADDPREQHDFSLEAQNVAAGKDEPFHLSIPLYSDWTPVKLRMQGGTPRLSVSLALKPYGTILALPINITSNLYFPFAVQCHVRSNAFTLKGAIKLGLLTADSKRTTMKGLPPVFEDVNQGKTTDLDPEGQQQDGYADYVFHCADGKGNLYKSYKPYDNSEGQSMKNKYIYTWVLPCKKNKTQKDDLTVKIGCGTISPDCFGVHGNFKKDIYDKKSNDNGKKVYDAVGDPFHYAAASASAPSVFAEGKTLKLGKKPISADIQSDMMITEVLNYDFGHYGISSFYNYSMVEITNPTVNHLNLNDYKLIRERTVKDGDLGAYQPSGNAQDDNTDINKAAMQDLYFPNATTNSQKKGGKDGSLIPSDVYSVDLSINYTKVLPGHFMLNRAQYYNIANEYKRDPVDESRGNGNFSPNNPVLDPGKSMVIMAGGYFAYDDGYNPPHILSPYIDDAIGFNKCEYALFAENGVDEYASQRSENSGVMDLGQQQVMILMKRKKSGRGFEPLDTSGPTSLAENNLGVAKSSYYSAYKNVIIDRLYRKNKFLLTRKDWVMKPTLRFDCITGTKNETSGIVTNTEKWDDNGGWILTVSKGDDNAAVASSVASPGSRFVHNDYRRTFPGGKQDDTDDNVNIYGVIPK